MKIFYLHGMGGSPADWAKVVETFPGVCLGVPSTGNFSDVVEKIAGRLREEKEPFVLCGYSLGGRLAAAAAPLLQESSLRGLVLLAAGMGVAEGPEREKRRAFDEKWAALARENLSLFWKDWYAQELFSSFHGLPEELRNSWMKERFHIDINKLEHQLRSLSPACHENLLPGLLLARKGGISVLYLSGERDKKYANLAGELQKKGIQAEILPGAGHILPLETPGQLSARLGAFLENLK